MEIHVWERACSLFEGALALEPGRRAGFRAAACPDDAEVRATAERMLAADDNPNNALDRLGAEVARWRRALGSPVLAGLQLSTVASSNQAPPRRVPEAHGDVPLSRPGRTAVPLGLHHEVDRRHAKAGERMRNLRRAFASAVKRAELPADLNPHDLRHRRVTTWLAEGRSPAIVQKAMGHSSIRTTLGDSHLVDSDLLQLVDESSEEELRGLVEG